MGTDSLEVRVRRGAGWHLGRACELSAQRIVVAVNGPPRIGDVVELELSLGAQSVLVSCVVDALVTAEAGDVAFLARIDSGLSGRLGLEMLVASGSLPALPPSRREARHPISWPVVLGDALVARALDVSRHGIFLAVAGTPGSALALSLPMDDDQPGDVQIAGRVARQIDGAHSRERLISAGIGVEIVDGEDASNDRFRAFVERVAQRGERRLLVVAAAARLPSLVREQTGLGYVTEGCDTTEDFITRATTGRSPDLVILHPSFDTGQRTAVRSFLAERHLAALALDSPRALLGRDVDRFFGIS